MSRRSAAEALPMPGAEVRTWRFDGFEFDTRRGELRRRGGDVIPLRPKAELLLRQLLSRPGCLFSRDELMAAIWPAAVVTDDSLVQCVGELRTALDDRAQRLIRTLPRRGYRLDAAVESFDPAVPPPVSVQPRPTRRHWHRRPRAWLLAAAVAAAGGGAAFYLGSAVVPIHIDDVVRSRATVAVMPFAVADEAGLRGAADAVADGVTAQLANRMGMRGIGRAATAAFDGGLPPLRQLASALQATHVATVRAASGAGARIAIDVQIVAVASGEAIWARHFESAATGAEPLATEVGMQVAVAMRRRGPVEAALRAARPGHTPDAADLALLGWGDLDTRKSLADVRRARDRFQSALRVDPRSAIALTGLSASYSIERGDPLGALTPAQVTEHERVTDLASQLAPDNDTALLLWGNMQLMRGRPDLALPAFEKANLMVPSQPGAYVQVAQARLLLGRADEVQALADRAVELGAGDARRVSPAYLVAAEAALMLGQDDRARGLARRAIAELPSNARAHATLAALDALGGRDEEAQASMAAFLGLWPMASVARYDEGRRSTHPVYLAQRARLYEGLRKAGLTER